MSSLKVTATALGAGIREMPLRAAASHSTMKITVASVPRQSFVLERAAQTRAARPVGSIISALPLAGCESFQRFLVHRLHGLVEVLAKAFGGKHAVIARVGNIDVEDLLRPARARGHDHDAVAEKDRLLE